MSKFKTAKARRHRAGKRFRKGRLKTARPICPECGSADVVVTAKTGKCNRCTEIFRAEAATSYPKGTSEQSASTDRPRILSDETAV